MKTLIYLSLLMTATIHAQPYSAEWSEFDSGQAASQAGAVAHAGVLSTWLRAPSQSPNYENQQGYPALPTVVPATGAPTLSIALVGPNIRLSWPDSASGFVLQEKSFLTGGLWVDVPGPYSSGGSEQYLQIPANEAGQCYRLRSP